MVSQGVSVIVRSESSTLDGPGDGTSPRSDSPLKAVDRAVEGGAIWVNSAGNAARETWFKRQPYSDIDSDEYIEFAGDDEGNSVRLDAGDEISVQLRWEDRWGGATRNFDIGLWSSSARRFVEISTDPQSGGAGHVPYEYLSYVAPSDGVYAVAVERVSGDEPAWIQLIFGRDVSSIEHYTKHGSIRNPAESANPGMLAVGAAPWYDVHTIEPFSSRGPTPDGRIKPDIVGADCGETALRPLDARNNGFCGTSQAAPHVAGMAALVRQRFTEKTPVEVAEYLKDHAERRETVPNNTWGYGFGQLPPDDAVATPPDATLTISPSEVNIGDTVIVTMSNYAPGPIAEIKIGGVALDLTDPALAISDLVVPSSGQHSFSFVIPATVGDTPIPLGRVLVEVKTDGTAGQDNHASTYLTINMPDTTDPCGQALSGDGPVNGQWAEGCESEVAGRGYARYYGFTLESGSEVTITLESQDADTYLYLRAGEARSGDYLNQNDDGGTTRSTIQETLAAGTYTVEATTYDPGETGSFTLSISGLEGTTAPPDTTPASDREALVALYNATGGPNWASNTGWLSDAPRVSGSESKPTTTAVSWVLTYARIR